MEFNHLVLVAAGLIGLAGGVAGAAKPDAGPHLTRALLAGIAASAGACVLLLVGVGRDTFAMTHLIYLIGTLAIPLAAAIMLLRPRTMNRWLKIALCVAVLGAPIGLYASHIEPFWLRVDRVELPTTPDNAGLRIGVLSDVQTISIGDYENDALDTLLAEEPDLVLVPGDLWQLDGEGYAERAAEFEIFLERLDASVAHVFMVNGDTDSVDGLRRLTRDTSIVVLDNEVVEVEISGTTVRVGGLSHNGDNSRRPGTIEPLAAGDADALRLLVTHRPGNVDLVPGGSGIDLVVAGHTHGGQIAIPFFGPPVTLADVPRSVAAGGLHELDGQRIYVSTGVGRERNRAPQVRFLVRPSVGVITTTGATVS